MDERDTRRDDEAAVNNNIITAQRSGGTWYRTRTRTRTELVNTSKLIQVTA